MSKFRKTVFATVLASLALGACSSQGTGRVVASLTRPADMAFACLDEQSMQFYPDLASCNGMSGAKKETRRLISFVIEATRGEVAAIDWQATRAIDSNRTVPGYTFVRVGETPSAIVIPPNDTRMTYVANFGSLSVQSLETAAFVPRAVQDVNNELNPSLALLPAGPSDLVFAEVGGVRWLFAPLPEAGSVAQIPLNADGSFGVPIILAVSSTVPAQVAAAAGEPEYQKTCPSDRYVREPSAPLRAPVTLGPAPKPNQLALLQRPNGVLELVATDAALPMIHRFTVDAAGLTELEGFAVAVPTVSIATTPLVPEAAQPMEQNPLLPLGPTKQYVYAIDAQDRSVLVVDVDTGAVLAVNVGDKVPDRIPVRGGAVALEVVTPDYNLEADPGLTKRCNPTDPADLRRGETGPTSLRGVFLSVSGIDGYVSFVDVFDLDSSCRGPSTCGGTGESNDVLVAIRRHRPRVGALAVDIVALTESLAFSYASNSGGITSSGAPTAGTGPGLDPIDDGDPATAFCPGVSGLARGQMAPVLYSAGVAAIAGQPLICVLDDAHAQRNQRFVVTYEGALATAGGARGRLVESGGARRFDTEDGSFCEWGVLGSQNVSGAGLSATDLEFGYGGDMLVITSDVPPELATSADCRDLVIPTSGANKRIRLGFEIVEAHAGHLVLGNFIPDQSITVSSRFNADPVGAFDAIRACFPTLVNYEVRAHGGYVLFGSETVAQHRVIDDGAGRCTIDVAGQPYDPAQPDTARAVRALPGRPFVHPQVAFQISAFQVPSGIQSSLRFTIGRGLAPLRRDAGNARASSLATEMHYNVADGRLYTIDSLSHTVVQFQLDPVSALDRVQ